MKWIKYNHKYAEGPSEIEYLEISERETEEGIKELIKALKDENYWNDGYRGLDYEVVGNLPVELLDKYIQDSKEYIKYYTNRITDLEKKKNEIKISDVEELILTTVREGSYSPERIEERLEYAYIDPNLAKYCVDKLLKDGIIYINLEGILDLW